MTESTAPNLLELSLCLSNSSQYAPQQTTQTPVLVGLAATPDDLSTTQPPSLLDLIAADKNNTPKRERIEDYGEHIGGARKDFYATAIFELSAVTESQVSTCKHLSDVISMPNVQTMYRNQAISTEQACAVFALWRSIPRSTRGRLQRNASYVINTLNRVKSVLEGDLGDNNTYEDYLKGLNLYGTTKDIILCEYNTLITAGYPANDFSFGNYQVCKHYCYDSLCITTVGRSGHYIERDIKTYPEVVTAMAALLAARKTPKKKSEQTDDIKAVKISFFRRYSDGKFYVTPTKKTQHNIVLMEWDTREEMRKYMSDENLRKEIYKKYWELANIPCERHTLNRPRIGNDWLPNGKNITPADLAAEFPFRGIEFGNWVGQKERAAFLNDTYLALRDMMAVLNISQENMTCNKDLAIAFGARGSGRFAAHYESLRRVINLTKTKGAGSLAHEWFHAIDRFASTSNALLTETINVNSYGSYPSKENKLKYAAYQLISDMQRLDYYQRCKRVDNLKEKAYWATNCEMAARAFETMIISILEAYGWRSDFLASCTKHSEWSNSKTYVYPMPDELLILAPRFEAFFKALFGDHVSFLTPEVINHIAKEANRLKK